MRAVWKQARANMVQAQDDSAACPIVLRGVTVRYGRRIALEGVSGEFPPASLTAVVGANGAGKSTLLAALAGRARLASGSVELPSRGRLGFLPQHAAVDPDYPLTVAEFVTLGGWRQFGAFRAPPASVLARATDAAATVGLGGGPERRVGALSAGELQRALFARLMLEDPAVILLDEPFAAVDAQTTTALLHQITRWQRDGRTVIAVLHDLAVVRAWFPTTLVLARRCLSWGPTESALRSLAV
jgi:zinc/manganese transport system ATP-binding protein